MGGSALKKVPTERLDKKAFDQVVQKVCQDLANLLGPVRVAPVEAYAEKRDFGDLDILVESEAIDRLRAGRLIEKPEDDPLFQWAQSVWHTREHYPNGPVISFEYRASPDAAVGFQVDLIMVPAARFEMAKAYFSFNDLGNLIGRVAHKMGFTYGDRGLDYPLREGTHMVGKVHISHDPDAILPFLGFDTERFHKGFANLEEIFQYVASSDYFNPDIYLLENVNHQSRTRDRKRANYRAFLNWCQEHKGLKGYPWASHEDREKKEAEKQFFKEAALRTFPDFEHGLDALIRRHEIKKAIRHRFNGEKVRDWTGLENRELGNLMKRLREEIGEGEQALAWLERHDEEQLRTWVLDHVGQPETSSRSRPRKAR